MEQPLAHASLRLLEQDGWIVLNDSGYVSAAVHIHADREALYDYQLRNKQADTVIKVMLRAYPGINLQYCDVSESVIAKFAKLPIELVVQSLEMAQKEGILYFHPRKDKPQLTFLRERTAADNLHIDLARFNFRKQRAEVRTNSAIAYAETRRCRSRQLLAYFDQPDSELCGICDVCTGRNKSIDLDGGTLEVYSRKIQELLRQEAMPFEEVLKAFSMKRHETVAQVLGYLMDEQIIVAGEDGKLVMAS